eukprot:m.63471 g.63471  ORF g.63471 m.63471 type:complete len:578 (+) comp9662_c0_seq1:45-1778(+)
MGLATKSIFVVTTTFVLLLRPSPVGAAPCEVSVETDLGLVIGETTELYDAGITPRSVRRFLGIPYSQPPIGDHRWKPPRSALPFDKGYFRATEWPDSCPNKLSSPSPFCRTCSTRSNPPLEPNSEDCLKLNIFTPPDATPESDLPVMVYVHGGGGTIGSGKMYSNSSSLVHHGVILVTINYRLGILGFLAHELLSTEQGGISGNYQVMDMIEALTWVKSHFKNFGGNPAKVTVFGQSFGGSAMQYLMLSPKAKGLYYGIISQSGGSTNDYATQEEVETTTGVNFFEAIGCTTLECAREKSWEDCVDSGLGRSQPNVAREGWIPKQPLDALRTGGVNVAPAIFGHDVVENHLNDYFSQKPYETFVETYKNDEYLQSVFTSQLSGGCATDRCKEQYPSTEEGALHAFQALYPEGQAFSNGYERYSALRTDRSNGMNTFIWAQEYARTAPAYRYVFTQNAAGSPTLGLFGCGHLVENLYVFGDAEIIGPGHVMTEGERATVETATKLWTDFAKTGAAASWPPFDSTRGGTTLVIGHSGEVTAVESWRGDAYAFLTLWKDYCGTVYPCPGTNVTGAVRSES